jgi:hypothetical protein
VLGCALGAGQVEVSDLTGRGRTASAAFDANDPTETLAVHCGNGFGADFSPYQSTRLSR